MKVSVFTVTYNHERFIAQAIESVLLQKRNFSLEIVIAEDCSTDRTREIVLDYQRRYPDLIHPLLAERNQGIMTNYRAGLRACRGEYIAVLDGDDYWLDPQKLQRQVDFLDASPDFVACGHKAWVVYENSVERHGPLPRLDKGVLTIEDLFHECWPPAVSSVYRRGLFGELPDWAVEVGAMGDWAVHVLNAAHGKFRLFPEPLAVYRQHGGSTWALKPKTMHYEKRLLLYWHFQKHFGGKYDAMLEPHIARAHYFLANEYLTEGNREAAREHCRRFLRLCSPGDVSMRGRASTVMRAFLPGAYGLLLAAARPLRKLA